MSRKKKKPVVMLNDVSGKQNKIWPTKEKSVNFFFFLFVCIKIINKYQKKKMFFLPCHTTATCRIVAFVSDWKRIIYGKISYRYNQPECSFYQIILWIDSSSCWMIASIRTLDVELFDDVGSFPNPLDCFNLNSKI